MKRSLPRVPVFTLFLLALAIAVIVLWVRSPRHTLILGFYTPAGHLQGLASDRGGVLLFVSNVESGPETALTTDSMSVSAEEFRPIHEMLFANEKWSHVGIRLARGGLDPNGTGLALWTYTAALVP